MGLLSNSFRWAIRLTAAGLFVSTAFAANRTIVMGGADGLPWDGGGGEVEAVFKTGPREVDTGNTPGGVVQFDPGDREGWIFPQRVDVERNLALDIPARGGAVTSPSTLESGIEEKLLLMIDDDGETALERKNVSVIRGMIMDFDLGARFGVNAVQFFPRNAHPDFPAPEHPFQEDFIRSYELFFNDGTEDTQIEGRPILTSFRLEGLNEDPLVEMRIPPQFVRFIRLESRTSQGFEIAEFRVFGTGFVPEARYLSNIFDLGPDLGLWGNIRWVEETVGRQAFAQAQVRTRTGLDDSPLVYHRRFFSGAEQIEVPWQEGATVETPTGPVDLDELELATARAVYDALTLEEKNAAALTLSDYEKLSGGNRGAVLDDLDAWSPWSSPYELNDPSVTSDSINDDALGVPIVSPGPRRYIQFSIDFDSDDLEAATGIGPLAFTVSTPPPAAEIIGEVFPRSARLAEPVDFTYAVMPTRIRPGVDTGFDRFEIVTPVRAERIDEVRVTYPDGRVESAAFSGVDLESLPVSDGLFGIEEVSDRRLRVRFPLIEEGDIEAGQPPVLQIRFRCRVLRFGTKFTGFASNSLEGGVGQDVRPGNVADLGAEDDDIVPVGTVTQRGLSVDIPLTGGGLLINVRAEPRPFTPNGDGVNDVTRITYDLSRILGAAPVTIDILDLGGRVVRTLEEEQGGGSFSVPWDGRDAKQNLVPPGIYLYRVTLDSDTGSITKAGAVELVY